MTEDFMTTRPTQLSQSLELNLQSGSRNEGTGGFSLLIFTALKQKQLLNQLTEDSFEEKIFELTKQPTVPAPRQR